MSDKTYGLYPFTWHPPVIQQVMSDGVLVDVTIPGYHSAPPGSLCVLDFRPIPQQSIQGQSGGYGFFAWEGSPPNDLIVLGVGDCRSIVTTPTMRNEIKVKLGLAQLPSGATLIDLIYDCLGPLAVPDGSTGVRPLMPTSADELEIHLSGHSLVKSLKFNPAQLLAANPTGHANKIRDVIRTNLDIADDAGKLPEALGHWLMRCGYSREEVKAGAPGKKTEFERLCSAKVKAKYGAAMKPKEPKTTLVEDWPTNGSITSGQDFTWAINTGAPLRTSGLTASGGLVSSVSGDSFYQAARCTDAMSSSDHWTTSTLTITNYYGTGSCVRMNATTTFYFGMCWYSNGRRLSKLVGGADTLLSSAAHSGGLSAVACETKGNGSTISCQITGYALLSVTDTAIPGNLLGGVIFLPQYENNHCWVGPTTITDGISPAPVAAFTGTPLSGTTPLSSAFDSSATTNSPTSHLWEKKLGAGAWENFAGTPTVANPTESFTTGTWSVRYTATNAGGSNTKTETDYIVVAEPPAPEESSSGHTRRTLTGLG